METNESRHTIISLTSINFQSLCLGCTVLCLSIYLFRSRKLRNLPPGPPSLPLIGNLLAIVKDPYKLHKTFYKFHGRYGDIWSIYFGPQLFVVLSSFDVIKEAVIGNADTFSDRTSSMKMAEKLNPNKGIIFENGKKLKLLRKITLTALRDFGVGKESIEKSIQDESERLVTVIENLNGQFSDIKSYITKAVSNIICSIVFGERFDYDDGEFSQMITWMQELFVESGIKDASHYLPFLAKLLGSKEERMLTLGRNLQEFNVKKLTEHKETYEDGVTRDFIDLFLAKQAEYPNDPNYSDESIIAIIRQLFIAGTDTTGTTLVWMINYLLHYPEVQKKCRAEIDRVIGNRVPSIKDKENCHYMMATIHELQRLANIGPHAIPHCCNKDMMLNGYHIPKDTSIILHLYAVHMNPDVFPKPEIFRPERWLDENGSFIKHEHFLPFSLGRRYCLGEQLAKMELFIFATTLLQKLEFSIPINKQLPALEGLCGVTLSCVPYKVCAKSRDSVQ